MQQLTPVFQGLNRNPASDGAGAGAGPGAGTCDVAAPSILASIVATIGPASEAPEVVRRLIEAGVGVFRFNFSHGDLATHAKRLETVRRVAREARVQVACLGDLQGPKIRVGIIPSGLGEASPSGGGLVRVEPGQDVIFKAGITEAALRTTGAGRELVLPTTYAPLVKEVLPGHRVLINDGAIRMLAVDQSAAAGELRCRVVVGGAITSNKGINVPQSDLSAPAITDRDFECVRWAVEHDLDYLALSFVRRADEVHRLRNRIASLAEQLSTRGNMQTAWIPIVSKIEMPQAVANLEAIVDASDAIMVARGDSGVEMDIARVPVVQKQIVAACARNGKPCIVATQMLETMIDNSTPTRAEASDVANAIFDGADAVMLSAETATGKHPVLVVETMARIVHAAEAHLSEVGAIFPKPTEVSQEHQSPAAIARGAWDIVRSLKAKVVVCWSQHGGTAKYLSQNRFSVPIVAYSSDPRTARRMGLLRGVLPVFSEPPGRGTLSDWNVAVDEYIRSRGLAKAGDVAVLVAGRPLGQAKSSNTIAIFHVGSPTSGYFGGGDGQDRR